MNRSHGKFLGLAACLAWAALPLAAQDTPRVELIQGRLLGATPPMREYVATHRLKPNPAFRVFPLRKPGSHPGNGGGGGKGGGKSGWTDPLLQTDPSQVGQSYSVGVQIDGIAGSDNSRGVVPPDTNIAVGLAGTDSTGSYPAQIVETVNVEYAVYGTDGTTLQNPAPIHSIFAAAAGGNLGTSDICATVDGGDPIVLYDKIDSRWIISQLAYNSSLSNDHFCLAISRTGDATGSYDAYDFTFSNNFPDYPKLGIWAPGTGTTFGGDNAHAGVYFSANIFAHGSRFTGAVMCAFRLSDVTSGASTIDFPCLYNPSGVYSILPADMEGSPNSTSGTTLPPPTGTAEYYLQFSGTNALNLYQFDPGFSGTTPSVTSTTTINVPTFQEACGGGTCVPQLGTSEQLDSLGDRLMYRLSYRNFGTSGSSGQSMVVTQSVQDTSSSNQTGIRWYQLTAGSTNTSTSGWGVGPEDTFGPSDGTYRWMGSIAQDKCGDLGVGYSVSSSSENPDIAFTGRTPGDGTGKASSGDTYDPLETATTLGVGLGVQTSVSRWGDYSSMSVDPTDDSTFWYANEYLKSNGSYTNWGTTIVGFQFSTCQ